MICINIHICLPVLLCNT